MFIEKVYWILGEVVAKRWKRSLSMSRSGHRLEKTKWWSGKLKTLLIDRSICCWHNWDDCLILFPSGAVPRKVSPVLLLTTCWCLVDSPPTRASSSQAKNHGLSNLSVQIYQDGRPPSRPEWGWNRSQRRISEYLLLPCASFSIFLSAPTEFHYKYNFHVTIFFLIIKML